MLVQFFRSKKPLRDFIFRLGAGRGVFFADTIDSYVKESEKLLDIGTGTGNVCAVLAQRGYDVTPIDVEDLSFTDEVTPTLYDGDTMPYKDDAFNTALLLTVLHHIPTPEATLDESARVAHRVIIIEDIYSNRLHKWVTFFCDSLFNFEFKGHPHSNKTDAEWKALFKAKGYKLHAANYTKSFVVFRHAVYVLDVN